MPAWPLDGDADRVGLVDEQGVFVNQLQVYALLSYYLLEVRGCAARWCARSAPP